MLVTLKEILEIAEKKKIAIGSFNASGLEAIEAQLAAAEELQLPIIIQFAQCHEPWVPLDTIGPIMVHMAKRASIPVCVHLDHGETLEYLAKALEIAVEEMQVVRPRLVRLRNYFVERVLREIPQCARP